MMTLSICLSVGGFLLVAIAWVTYLGSIPKGKVPVWPTAAIVQQLLGVGLGVFALTLEMRSGEGISLWVINPLSLSVGMVLFFAYLLSIRKTPIGDITVAVGDAYKTFEAATSEGNPFRSEDAFAGKRILLKFFRGGW